MARTTCETIKEALFGKGEWFRTPNSELSLTRSLSAVFH